MIDLLAAQSRNLFMVGDEDQSISASGQLTRRHLSPLRTDTREQGSFSWETNYRSRQEIVRAAGYSDQKNKNRHPEEDDQAAREGGGCVTEIKAVSRQGQYNYLLKVAQDCEQETAVLYRNNESALPIVDLLERKGLSCRVKNSDMTFFSHPVVNDICDFYSVVSGSMGWGGISSDLLQNGSRYQQKAAMEAVDANTRRLTLLRIRWRKWMRYPFTPENSAKALATHLDNMRYESAGKAIYRILNYMGYQEFMDTHRLDSGKAEILKAPGRSGEQPVLISCKITEAAGDDARGLRGSEEYFILSTIHSSKGLEYTRVYLADMLAGVIPSPDSGRGLCTDSPEANAYEEEREAFYVGMTRAKRNSCMYLPLDRI